jgi:hypothetical protein
MLFKFVLPGIAVHPPDSMSPVGTRLYVCPWVCKTIKKEIAKVVTRIKSEFIFIIKILIL